MAVLMSDVRAPSPTTREALCLQASPASSLNGERFGRIDRLIDSENQLLGEKLLGRSCDKRASGD